MKNITEENFKKLCRLSGILYEENLVEEVQSAMRVISADETEKIDLKKIAGCTYLREDIIVPSLEKEVVTALSPCEENGYFCLPGGKTDGSN